MALWLERYLKMTTALPEKYITQDKPISSLYLKTSQVVNGANLERLHGGGVCSTSYSTNFQYNGILG